MEMKYYYTDTKIKFLEALIKSGKAILKTESTDCDGATSHTQYCLVQIEQFDKIIKELHENAEGDIGYELLSKKSSLWPLVHPKRTLTTKELKVEAESWWWKLTDNQRDRLVSEREFLDRRNIRPWITEMYLQETNEELKNTMWFWWKKLPKEEKERISGKYNIDLKWENDKDSLELFHAWFEEIKFLANERHEIN